MWVLPVDRSAGPPTPTSCASSTLRFISRQGADAIDMLEAPSPTGPGDEVVVRPRRRRPPLVLLIALSGDGAGRAGDQARQPGACSVSPESARLLTMSASTSSIPLRAIITRPIRLPRRVVTKDDPASSRVGASSARPPRCSCRRSATSYSRAISLWSGPRPARRAGQVACPVVDGGRRWRFRAAPRQDGINGWAQINGWRGEITIQRGIMIQ